jgi:hypothetical protein
VDIVLTSAASVEVPPLERCNPGVTMGTVACTFGMMTGKDA